MIFCDFNYCIYNEKGECGLAEISISSIGVCDDCMLPDIGGEKLETYKKETLEKMERRKLGASKNQ